MNLKTILLLAFGLIAIAVTYFVLRRGMFKHQVSSEHVMAFGLGGAVVLAGAAVFLKQTEQIFPQPASMRRHLVEVFLLARDDPIRHVQGSFGLIILSDRDSAKSRAVCSIMSKYYYRGRYSANRRLDDEIYQIKPVYWPVMLREPNYNTGCKHLLAYYDLSRANAMKNRLGISGKGPFLITAIFAGPKRTNVASMLVYDLSSVPDDEMQGTFKQYLDDYVVNRNAPRPITADRRQRIKTRILAFSRPVAKLFGVEPEAQ